MKILISWIMILSSAMGLMFEAFAAEQNLSNPSPPLQFHCFQPIGDMNEFEFEIKLSDAVGMAVLYPRFDTWYSDVEVCLLDWFVSEDFSLAGYTWDTHHALLRMMSADPEKFFTTIKVLKPSGYTKWKYSLNAAELWISSEKCPKPSSLQLAKRAISGFNFKDPELEKLRIDVLKNLKPLACKIPQ